LHLADDGVAGLALAGRLAPDILIVDPALPSIDAAALLTGLRSHALFARSRLIVVTALDEPASAPYAFALEGMPVAHKSRLASELPPLLDAALAREASPS
jgi:DNA-binding response OmpR family regulator